MTTPAAASGPAGAITFTINGTTAELPESMLLLSALRDRLGLTGAKLGCGEGACGACTVLADGEPIKSCQRTAGSVAGSAITTIEGLADGSGPPRGSGLHAVQRAFAEECAAQCGFCTPGMVLTTVALLSRDSRPTDRGIDAALAGQICRCGCYPRIRQAVHRAAELSGGGVTDSDAGADADRWGPPLPGGPQYRPERPWDLTPVA